MKMVTFVSGFIYFWCDPCRFKLRFDSFCLYFGVFISTCKVYVVKRKLMLRSGHLKVERVQSCVGKDRLKFISIKCFSVSIFYLNMFSFIFKIICSTGCANRIMI